MEELLNNGYFWQKIDSLVLSTNVVITQEKGSHHPKYLNMVYPVNYGHLEDTDAIKVFKGSMKKSTADAVMIVGDILKRDLEVVELARKNRALERALRTKIDPSVYDDLVNYVS